MSNIYPLKRDDDFDGLDQLSALYKETRAGIKPPPELDMRIRAAAREALKPRKPITPRWAGGFAIAAAFVLGIGLVTLVQQEVPETNSSAPAAVNRAAESPPASPAAQPAPAPALLQLPQVSGSLAEPAADISNQNASRGASLKQIQGLSQQAKARRAVEAEHSLNFSTAPDSIAIKPSGTVPKKSLESEASNITASVTVTASEPATVSEEDKPLREAKAWLEDIIELQKTANEAEFKKQLAAFKKAYPDYSLPPSLSSP